MTRFRRAAWTVAFLALASSLPAQTPRSNPNLLPNPGFELAEPGRNVPQHWISGAGELDTAAFHSGKQSLHFKLSGGADPKAGVDTYAVMQLGPLFEPGKSYTLSVYVRTRDLRGHAYLYAGEYPAPFPLGTLHTAAQQPAGTTDWTRLSLTFRSKPNIGGLQIRLGVTAPVGQVAGEAWFDDCKLEEGDAPTAYVDAWQTDYYLRGGGGAADFPVPYAFKVSTEVQTPCADPARPIARSKPSVLFVTVYTLLRLPVELRQRMEMEIDCVPTNAQPGSHLFVECVNRMRERLQLNPQVLVVDADTYSQLLEKDRALIAARIEAGMGLVLYFASYGPNTRPEGAVKEMLAKAERLKNGAGVPLEPAWGLAVYKSGAGRIVTVIPVNRPVANTFQREWEYDRGVRAIHAALGESPVAVKATPAPVTPAAGESWRLRCEAEAPVAAFRVRLRPARTGSAAVALPFIPVDVLDEQKVPAEGGLSAGLAMPPIPAGNYILETSALNGQGAVVGWSLSPVHCDGPIRVWSVDAADGRVPAGGVLEAVARVENRSEKERSVTLAASVWDTEGRLLSRQPAQAVLVKPGMTPVPLRVQVRAVVTPQVRVRVELLDGDTALDMREQPLSAEALLPEPDFRFLYYMDFDRGIRRLGADTSVAADVAATDAGLRLYPWVDLLPRGAKWLCLEQSDSVTSPDTRAKVSRYLADVVRKGLPYRPVACIINDEWSLQTVPAQAPADTAYFRSFLRQMYGTVDKLNESWSMSLKSFDDVTLDLCTVEQVQKGASPARWADLRRMYEVAVAEYIQAISEGAKKVDPVARLGLSGTQEMTARSGLDYWLLMKVQGSTGSYGGVHSRLEESFASEGTRIYQWSYPSQDMVVRARHDPWRDLVRQRDGYLHYGGHWSELFAPDYQPYPAALACAEEIRAIRSGPARLIRSATRDNGRIGILFSMASYHAAWLQSQLKTGVDIVNDVLYSTDSALSDVGIDSRFYSYEQLARGDITPETVSAFFLGQSLALSADEAAAVRRYVERGGVVIADVRPAIYDTHCHALKTGALDDLFGIEPQAGGPSLSKAGVLEPGPTLAGLAAAAVRVGEMDLRLKPGATAWGQVALDKQRAPALVVNNAGKGKAVLLNCAFPEYTRYRAGGLGGEVSIVTKAAEARPMKYVLAALLKRCGNIEPAVQLLKAADGTHVPGRIYLYRDGAAIYAAVEQHYSTAEADRLDCKLVVNLPGEVYNVRTGEHLGKVGNYPVVLERGVVQLYAVLPYAVARVGVEAPPKAAVGQELPFKAFVEPANAKAGRHILVARLARPDGSSCDWDRFTILAPDGRGEGRYGFAMNDPAGVWTLTISDAATGVKKTVNVEVTAK